MTDLYTLGLEVRSDGVVVASNRLNQLAKDGKNAEGATNRLSSASNSLTGYLKAAAAAFSLWRLYEFAKDLMNASLQMERLNRLFVGATGGAASAASEMAYIRNAVSKMGLDLPSTIESYGKFTAAIRGTVLQGEEGRKVFEGVSAATVALGLRADETSGIFNALQQMVSKGTVQAEELRGQLGERLPGAFNMAAKAMGMTTSELGKQLELGNIMASDLLPKLATELQKTYGKAAAEGANSAQSKINAMNTAIFDMKVQLAEVVSPAITEVITTFTEKLNEIGKWMQENPATVKTWGLTLLGYLYQVSAEFIRLGMLLDKIGGTLTSAQMLLSGPGAALGNAGATKRFEAAAQANIDFEERYNQKDKMLEGLALKMNDIESRIESAKGEVAKAKTVTSLPSTISTSKAEAEAEKLAAIIKKNREQWAGIVVEQLGSVGAYSQSAAKQIELNKLTDEYKTMQKAALEVPEAAAALKAQELLDHQKILEAKRKEMQMDTDHQATMLSIQSEKLASLGYDQESIYLKNGYLQALNEELVIQNQIATEINPKTKSFLQEQLTAQQELNRLKKIEAEEQQHINELTGQLSAYNDLIKMQQATGADSKQTEQAALQAGYNKKVAEYQQAITKAQNTGKDLQASITQQSLDQLNALYAQSGANDANLAKLKEILGVQQGITGEVSKQKDNNALIDEYNASIVQTRTRDEQYEYDKYTVSGIGHAELGHFYGIFYGMVEDAAKERIRQYEQEKRAAEDAKMAQDAQTEAAEKAKIASELAAEASAKYAERLKKQSELEQDLSVRYLEAQGLNDQATIQRLLISQQNELNKAMEDGLDVNNLVKVQQLEYNKTIAEINKKQLQESADAASKIFDETKSKLESAISEYTSSIQDSLDTINSTIKALIDVAAGLRSTSNKLLSGSESTLSPEQLYLKAQSDYNATKALAMTGDIQALQKLSDLAETYITASRSYYGSNSQYASNFTSVQTDLNSAASLADSIGSTLQPQADLLEQQVEILNAIRDAIKIDSMGQFKLQVQRLSENKAAVDANAAYVASAGNVNSVATLNALSTVNGSVGSSATTVSGSVGASTSSLSSSLNILNGTTGNVTTAIGGTNTALTSTGIYSLFNQYQSNYSTKQTTANDLLTQTKTNTSDTANRLASGGISAASAMVDTKTKTSGSYDILNNSVIKGGNATGMKGQVAASKQRALSGTYNGAIAYDTTYEYFANGGIANTASIFGEAGPEAAVPLPDGRSIPVTLSRPDNYGDTSALLAELRSLRADVNQLRQESVGELREIKSPLRRAVAGR